MSSLMEASSVRKVAIVGTGTIGSGWAALFVARGYIVKAYVRSAASEDKFRSTLQVTWRKFESRGLVSDPEGWRHVACVQDLKDCVSDADYVQESVVEELSVKLAIIEQIDEYTPPHVLIGSSTSFIPLSMVRARARRYPERIAIAHPLLPQWDDFVEVLGSRHEDTQWLATLLGRQNLGMDTIMIQREMYGHAHNFCLGALVLSAISLVKAGVTSVEELDRAMCHLARLLLAGGGASGALIGLVGNGSFDAVVDLSTDISLSAPPSIGACIASWLLPSPLAKFYRYVLRLLFNAYTRLAFVKRLTKRFIMWMLADFHSQWRAGSGAVEFEQRGLRRMIAISNLK